MKQVRPGILVGIELVCFSVCSELLLENSIHNVRFPNFSVRSNFLSRRCAGYYVVVVTYVFDREERCEGQAQETGAMITHMGRDSTSRDQFKIIALNDYVDPRLG